MSQHDRDKQNRRRRARETIEALRVRVRRICGRVGDIDSILDDIVPIAREIRAFAEGPQGRELVPDRERRLLLDAAKQFEGVRGRIDTLADACDLVQKALQQAEEAIPGEPASGPESAGNGDGAGKLLRRVLGGTVLGGVVIAAVVAFLVIDSDDPVDPDDVTPNDPENCFEECLKTCLSEQSEDERFQGPGPCEDDCTVQCPDAREILHDQLFTAGLQEGPRTFLSPAASMPHAQEWAAIRFSAAGLT